MNQRKLWVGILLFLIVIFIFATGTFLELRKDAHTVAPQTTLAAAALNLVVFFLGLFIPAKKKQSQVIRAIICVVGMTGAVLSIIATIVLM